ncbi:hypothetical protein V8B55DRAFT_1432223 [Mucor lusitanicus]
MIRIAARHNNNIHHRSLSDATSYYCRDTNTIYDINQSCEIDHKKHISFENDNRTVVEDEENEDKEGHNYISTLLEHLEDLYSKYSFAIVLENKGNTARDHLANERTYLAWFRTSLSLITLGIGIIQVYHVSSANHKRLGRALGLIFVMASILFLYFGNVRYFHAQWALQHGNFPASRGVVTWASFCILFLFVGMFTVMVLESNL